MSLLQPPQEPIKESSAILESGLNKLSPEERREAIAIMDSLPLEKRDEVKALLNDALMKGKITKSPSRWLHAVVRRKSCLPLSASAALGMTEQEFEQKLILGGISPDDARFITKQTITNRKVQQRPDSLGTQPTSFETVTTPIQR